MMASVLTLRIAKIFECLGSVNTCWKWYLYFNDSEKSDSDCLLDAGAAITQKEKEHKCQQNCEFRTIFYIVSLELFSTNIIKQALTIYDLSAIKVMSEINI